MSIQDRSVRDTDIWQADIGHSPSTGPSGEIKELASGVDALYLSGRAVLGPAFLERLVAGRLEAELWEAPVAVVVGGETFDLLPRGSGKYRFCLVHPYGQLSVTPSEQLPSFRIQPRAEFLHGVGPADCVEWFRGVLERECGPVVLTVSRIDLHADWQGWELSGDDRHRFLCRADARATYEDGGILTGFEFGRRSSKTVCARIYDKTAESAKNGSDYWADVWGADYDNESHVVRVEFEINRVGLRQYGLDTPEEVLAATGALWADLTSTWLSYRRRTEDETKSRWPIALEWEQIRRARLVDGTFGIRRMYEGRRRGDLRMLAPGLVGYLSSFAVLTGAKDWASTAGSLAWFVRSYCREGERSFEDRIAVKQRETLLP
ncbi:MAG TPA: hypothetical protein VHU85_17775 [Acidimicrobiales bacterium]|jgi:hypothetical protein|nr:hypothetical protein [Acidimicrobiales bacterium]